MSVRLTVPEDTFCAGRARLRTAENGLYIDYAHARSEELQLDELGGDDVGHRPDLVQDRLGDRVVHVQDRDGLPSPIPRRVDP